MEHGQGRHLIIRADASSQIGTGHFMRCLALAQAWKDAGGQVIFITACESENLLQRLQEEDFDIHLLSGPYPDAVDWGYTNDIMAEHPGTWVVLDGYHFDEVYQRWVKDSGHSLLVIDDMAHLKHYYADIVLNQNLHAEQLRYLCEPYTHLLLGTQYVLLRREFLAWKDWKRDIPEVARRVLVTLGGGDPENHTLRVIQALQRVDIPALEATVVIGASNPHADGLEAAAEQSRVPIRLSRNVENMPELMAWADLTVATAGTTIWELLFLRTPTLAVVSADNQRHVAEQIETEGLARTLGRNDSLSIKRLAKAIALVLKDANFRTNVCEKARQIVDGAGAQRVIAVMQETRAPRLRLRPATLEDCRLLWEWANDPVARAASFSPRFIDWQEHVRWFEANLGKSCFHCYVVLNDNDLPVGQVRFDTMGTDAEISVSIGSDFRGRGYGAEAIRSASEQLFRETSVTRIYAHIKQGNIPSTRAFARANYKEGGAKVVKGHHALQMTLNKDDGLLNNGQHQDQ